MLFGILPVLIKLIEYEKFETDFIENRLRHISRYRQNYKGEWYQETLMGYQQFVESLC